MIPKLIQRQGAQHLAEQEAHAPAPPASPAVRPPTRLLELIPSRSVLELIPESVCRQNVVIPLRQEGEVLVVAAADPNDIMLADKLSFIVNKKVRLVALPRIHLKDPTMGGGGPGSGPVRNHCSGRRLVRNAEAKAAACRRVR